MTTLFLYKTPQSTWLEFRYKPALIDLLRDTIPGHHRRWNHAARVHEITDPDTLAEFLALAEQDGHTPYWAPDTWWAQHEGTAA